ncbi:YqgE/AlgH family protein [Faecalibacter sp. LW9]|uniref:YqgE/AlgH family protein n=1 Tax=Faecalibacter sp. LW9 TaxID=3103144 RepID=UPI002AFE3674|nr:YqgE/AlgH family protein [Faecalibacter sp. LW9]
MSIKSIKKGAILVARPSLNIDIFNRSVILITETHENGTVGFIINRSLEVPMRLLAKDLPIEDMVYEGGLVDKENIYYIHQRPDLIRNSLPIAKNLFWSGNFEDVERHIKSGEITSKEIKFFLGYTGWAMNQLETEIEKYNEWDILPEHSIDIFRPYDHQLWKSVMKKLGGDNLIWLNTPLDPSLN